MFGFFRVCVGDRVDYLYFGILDVSLVLMEVGDVFLRGMVNF